MLVVYTLGGGGCRPLVAIAPQPLLDFRISVILNRFIEYEEHCIWDKIISLLKYLLTIIIALDFEIVRESLYPQKLALTSPTSDGRSVGIVRSRTKATEFSLVLVFNVQMITVIYIFTIYSVTANINN
jgi:hypothetical protein